MITIEEAEGRQKRSMSRHDEERRIPVRPTRTYPLRPIPRPYKFEGRPTPFNSHITTTNPSAPRTNNISLPSDLTEPRAPFKGGPAVMVVRTKSVLVGDKVEELFPPRRPSEEVGAAVIVEGVDDVNPVVVTVARGGVVVTVLPPAVVLVVCFGGVLGPVELEEVTGPVDEVVPVVEVVLEVVVPVLAQYCCMAPMAEL